ncbi:Utp14-domain-containing protein [Lactarius hengduanensis]|nr:Utp14-domain-containing protein [Lactarius hengduanensis]
MAKSSLVFSGSSKSTRRWGRQNPPRNPLRSDVYEYQSQKVRRANEANEHGFDSDGDLAANIRKPRLIGESVEDEEIPSEDDEELDSDAAFEDSDEERFAGFSFPKSRGKTPRKRSMGGDASSDEEVDLDEEGDSTADPEVGNSEDFVDILDILDGRTDGGTNDVGLANVQHHGVHGAGTGPRRDDGEEEGQENDHDEEEGEDEEEEDGPSWSADEDVDQNALEGLEKFVSSLETSKKRQGDGDIANTSLPRKKRLVEEKTAVGEEREFAALPSGQQLRLNDLLAPLATRSSAVLSLKKSVKILDSSRARGVPLPAPLPQRTQERLDREAAYEQTKAEIDKWTDTMKQIKEVAEHLSFPLQAEPVAKTSNLELIAKFKPSTELETAVDQLLKRAQMREEDIPKTEELKMNHLSTEEVASRRAEVMKTRELLFRAEAKAKRIAKIKSKTYRRLRRRDKEKHRDEGTDSGEPEESLKRQAERAKERATLRHKSTGKWARAMRQKGEMDADQRRDMAEMHGRGEMLRRKIQGEQESSESDYDDDGDGEGLARLKARVFDELAEIKSEKSDPPKEKSKSVFDMKFMQDAAAREQREVNQQVDDLMNEVEDLDNTPRDDEIDGHELTQEDPTVTFQRTGGRISLRPSGLTSILTQRPTPSDASSTTLKSTDIHSFSEATPTMSPVDSQTISIPQHSRQPRSEDNPWLSRNDISSFTTLKKSEVAVSKGSDSVAKAKNKLRKRQRETEDEVAKARDDAVLEITPADLLLAPSQGSRRTRAGTSDSNSDEDDEVEEQEERLKRKGAGRKYNAFEQRDLVTMAFAGDNVVEEFEETKRREIEDDAPREVDTSLPGWGAWGGQGTRKAPPKPHLIKKIAGITPQSRADFGKAHVIISEKRDKKAAKYLVQDLPYPYTGKAQFERSLENPLGKEWNTRTATQRATLPKITKKMGTIIKPLEKPV